MKRQYWFWIIMAVIAILGGFLGGLVINSIQKDSLSTSILGPDIDLSGQKSIVINDAKKVVVNQDLRIQELSASLSASLVGVYKKTATSTSLLESYYNFDKAQAVAWPLSSDGWVLLNQSSNTDLSNDLALNYKNYSAVLKGRNNSYAIDKVYIPKKTTPFILLHLASVSDLPVREFAMPDYMSAGQLLLQQSYSGKLAINYLADSVLNSGLRNSEPFNRKLSLAFSPEKDLNSFVFDLGGALVAITSADGSQFVVHDYYPAIKEYFRSANFSGPTLGISYYDLSDMFRKDFNSKNPKRGAYISAFTKNSVAATAGLKVGDVITSFNGVELDDSHDLAELLKPYKASDKVLLNYVRNQENKELTIILGKN